MSFFPVGYIHTHIDGSFSITVRSDGTRIPYPHGETLRREDFPELYHVVAHAWAVPTTETDFTLPDFRGRIVDTSDPKPPAS